MDDDNSLLFSSGLELANFIATSDLLEHSWKAILKVRSEITADESMCLAFYGHYDERSNCRIIAFVTTPNCTENPLEEEGGGDLVSLSDLKDEFTAFEFLCSKGCSDSAINGAALDLFCRFYHFCEQEILGLISNRNTQYIITGHALGGWIASLFTLLLLDVLDPTKPPLCITYGSPLLGNEGLQKAISELSKWPSFFLHVVSNHDPLPRRFLNHRGYYPFGTFLFCSEFGGCACSEDPTSTLKLLEATTVQNNPLSSLLFDYKETIDRLINWVTLKGTTKSITKNTESLRGSFIAQIDAIGAVKNHVQQHQHIDVNRLASVLVNHEMNMIFGKIIAFNPFKTLGDLKIWMASIECYQRYKSNNIGYYDSYKNASNELDFKVAELKKFLRVYWENVVEQQSRLSRRRAPIRLWYLLFAGTNYRRFIEPLDIAEHYRKGLNNYESHRPKHYRKLEEWFEEECAPHLTKQSVPPTLTRDSCFWAHVEEAILECQKLKMVNCSARDKEVVLAKLTKFEDYVVELMKNYDVSSEIFLPHSTFMRWWEEYDEIVGDDHDSVLTRLMRNEEYVEYAKGWLEII